VYTPGDHVAMGLIDSMPSRLGRDGDPGSTMTSRPASPRATPVNVTAAVMSGIDSSLRQSAWRDRHLGRPGDPV
jgi:hypothetical protein